MPFLSKLQQHLDKMVTELKRKRTIEGFLNYGMVSFGRKKGDYLVRATAKPLAEHNYFTVRYLALIDILILLGLVIGILGYQIGWGLAILFFGIAVMVFVAKRELEKRAKMVKKSVRKPVKTTARLVKKTPMVLHKLMKKVEK
jgi:ABC-type multidrug transport system fused ATPase/permease subunit